MSFLSATKIRKSFLVHSNRVMILEDLDFSMREGEFVSIIGSSGCGKSTLLELFAGITLPDSGTIVYDGTEITGKGGYLGYMPQEDLLFPWLNSFDNALLPARIKGLPLKDARMKIEELLPIFGLEKHAKLMPYQLSGGLKQRVSLLRTYMTGSRLLLLDEPLASLDALTRMLMQDWLQEIKERLSLSIILVTHDISEAIKLSDRIELMCPSPGRFCQSFLLDERIRRDLALTEALKKEIVGQLHLS